MHDGFKVIKRKRNRQQKSKFENSEGSAYESRAIFNKKLQKAVEEFKSSQFCFEVLEAIEECLTTIGLNSVNEILCYGIGNCADSKSSLHQLAALIVISRKYNSSVIVYDPVLTSFETGVLSELSFKVLSINEEGKREVTGEEATLVFLPHCPKQLTNNFLWANWSISLHKCILIANSFSKIIQDNTEKILQESAKYIVKINSKTKEVPLKDCYHIENTFNDISLHYFNPQDLDSNYFKETLEGEPQYLKETELVTKLNSFNVKDE